jgi:hypothetical protein
MLHWKNKVALLITFKLFNFPNEIISLQLPIYALKFHLQIPLNKNPLFFPGNSEFSINPFTLHYASRRATSKSCSAEEID